VGAYSTWPRSASRLGWHNSVPSEGIWGRVGGREIGQDVRTSTIVSMKPLWILLVLAAAAGHAQTTGARPPAKKAAAKSAPKKDTAPAPTTWPIESLRVEGNRIYTADQVLAVAALKVGQVAGKPEFDAARDRLVASGAFETVGYRFEPASQQGYSATFLVTEVAPAYPWRFEDLGVPATEIEAVLKAKDPLFSTKMPASRVAVDR